MHLGRLRADGTPLFLKENFGKGYEISMHIEPVVQQNWIIAIKHFLNTQAAVEAPGSLKIEIPKSLRQNLASFFRYVEANSETVIDITFSNTTLEEVYLRLLAQDNAVNAGIFQNSSSIDMKDTRP